MQLSQVTKTPPLLDATNYHFFSEAFNTFEIQRIRDLAAMHEEEAATIGDNVIDISYRKSNIVWLPEEPWLSDKLGTLMNMANHAQFGFNLTHVDDKIQFTKYGADDQHYDYHLDCGKGSNRKLSLIVQLSNSEDYDGGDFILKTGRDDNYLPRGRGNVLVMPSFLLHRVTPVTRGTRESLVIWACGPHFV